MAKKPMDAEVVADVMQKFRDRNSRVFERQWMLNLAFYVGNQYLVWNRMTNRLMPLPSLRPHQVRLVVNKIMPAVQMGVGRMIKNLPVAEVIPPDGDEEKVNVAKVATKVLAYRDRVTNMEQKVQKMLTWSCIAGTSFLKHTWNPDLGNLITVNGETMPEGDEETTVCSPFEIAVDPLAQDVESAHWMMHFRLHDKDYVKTMWGIDVEATESAAQDTFGLMDMRFAGDTVLGGLYMPPKGVLVREYWERPCDDYPDGRLIITAGDQIAYQGTNYMDGELPFVRMAWNEVPNSFWARGIVEDMMPLQKNYNRRRSQIAENANMMSNPAWIGPTGSFLQGKEPTNAPAQIIEYNPNGIAPPQPVSMPSLPQQVYQDLNQSDQELGDVSGIKEIGPGMLPPGVRAAAALALINEMMQTQLEGVTQNLEYAIRESAKLRLMLIRKFYKTERDIHVAGPNRSYAVVQFKGADIDDEYDINIQTVSGLPQDKTARSQILMQLLQLGIIDQMKYLQLMELSDVDEVFEDMQADINAAQWENDEMAKGKPQDVHDFENHKLHIYEHNKFRKSAAFKKLSAHKQQLFEVHVQAHEQFLQQEQTGQTPQSPDTQKEMDAQSQGPTRDQQADALLGIQPGQPPPNTAQSLQSGLNQVNHQAAIMAG